MRGYVLEEAGARSVWMFDVSPSLVPQFSALPTRAQAGEPDSMTLMGWQVSLDSSTAQGSAGRELRVSFQDGEVTAVWPLADSDNHPELTDFQQLLSTGLR